MTIKLCTFTDNRMTISANKLILSAQEHGAAATKVYTPEDLPMWFLNHHKEVLKHERGFGFYCWKPYIVSDMIHSMNDGDILVYADAGQTIINNLRYVTDRMDSDVFLFSNGWPAIEWTKMDCWDAILGERQIEACIFGNWDAKSYNQTQASLIFFRVSKESKDFCKEWLAWSLMPGLIDNEPSKMANYPTFAEHRWDQAILGCLQIKYNIPLHWFPALTAQHLDKGQDQYPSIVDHHRRRNPGTTQGRDSEW